MSHSNSTTAQTMDPQVWCSYQSVKKRVLRFNYLPELLGAKEGAWAEELNERLLPWERSEPMGETQSLPYSDSACSPPKSINASASSTTSWTNITKFNHSQLKNRFVRELLLNKLFARGVEWFVIDTITIYGATPLVSYTYTCNTKMYKLVPGNLV